jgi:hypothetical protein
MRTMSLLLYTTGAHSAPYKKPCAPGSYPHPLVIVYTLLYICIVLIPHPRMVIVLILREKYLPV